MADKVRITQLPLPPKATIWAMAELDPSKRELEVTARVAQVDDLLREMVLHALQECAGRLAWHIQGPAEAVLLKLLMEPDVPKAIFRECFNASAKAYTERYFSEEMDAQRERMSRDQDVALSSVIALEAMVRELEARVRVLEGDLR